MRRLLCGATLTFAAWACSDKDGVPAQAAPTQPEISVESGDRDAYAEQNGLELRKFDLNRDQQPDVFKFFRAAPDAKAAGASVEQLVRKDVDLNHDGKVDVIRLYGPKGEVTEERTDLDFDGRFDELAVHENGALTRKEIDLNYDGRPDIARYYADGKVARVESDRNGDGRVDTWEYYEQGALDRVGTDNDGDGIVDHWERTKKAAEPAPETVPTEEAAPPADRKDAPAPSGASAANGPS